LGSTYLPPDRALAALLGAGAPGDAVVIWEIRLPRALAAFAVGAALGASGAALQGLLRNPLAEPGVLGVSACSALGATIALYFGLSAGFAFAVPIGAVLGAGAATALIAFAAVRVQSAVAMILIGVGLSSFAGAVMALILNFAPHPFFLADLINWTLGSVENRSLDDLLLAAGPMALGLAILLAFRRGLSALTLGEEAAAGVGLDLARQRLAVVVGAGLATGASVALAGAIGFVGIVAPHLVRRAVGGDPARALVPAALAGGLILVAADVAVRLIATTNELKLGVAAALIGAPAFMVIAWRRGGRDG
jgi:iron complex transport system permease protein